MDRKLDKLSRFTGKGLRNYHFRKTFTLTNVPSKFIVHVSGDNRYRLFVNGKAVCSGPAGGDLANWNFETVDISTISC